MTSVNLPTDATSSTSKIPRRDTLVDLQLVPDTAVSLGQQLAPMPIADGQWQVAPNPSAGVVECEWLEQNLKKLHAVAGLWVAIKGKGIRASSDDLEQLLDWLADQQISDALVTQIPEDVASTRYVIA
jgi:hypothetical protein